MEALNVNSQEKGINDLAEEVKKLSELKPNIFNVNRIRACADEIRNYNPKSKEEVDIKIELIKNIRKIEENNFPK